MRKLAITCFLIFLLLSTGLLAQRRVAVIDFEFGTVQRWWENDWDIGKGIADMIVDELVNDPNTTFIVVERKQLERILAEQNFSNSDRADASTAARIGKVLGVSAMIMGSITQFGVEKKGFSVGGIGGKFGGFGGAKVGTQKGKAKVGITARMVDVNTAQILASVKGEGESKRSGLLLGGGGVGGGGFGAGEISMTSSEYRETILGEATSAAVTSLSQQLVAKADKVQEVEVEVRGLIADVDGSTVILNVGANGGVKAGMTLKILRVTRAVKDPATGKVLREISDEVGQVRIDSTDEVSAVGTIVSGSGIKVGDKISN